jgi:hypothetical protein
LRESCVHGTRTVAGDARDVVILLGDSALGSEKSSFRVGTPHGGTADGGSSRDQPGGLADLYGLGAPFCAELIEEAAGMGLHRVFAEE